MFESLSKHGPSHAGLIAALYRDTKLVLQLIIQLAPGLPSWIIMSMAAVEIASSGAQHGQAAAAEAAGLLDPREPSDAAGEFS